MRIGLIGCGGIAQVHARVISELGEGFELAAVADCELPRAKEFAEEYGAVPYQDWISLLSVEKLDAIHICTPHFLHQSMAAEALLKGIHVFLEKPPVITREQYVRLKSEISRAKFFTAAGRPKLAVCFQNRFNRNVQYARKLLQEERLGKLKGVRGFVTWCRDAAYYADSPWRGAWKTEGGGALINQGIHTLDLMQYLIGHLPVSVDAVLSNFHLKGGIEVEDTLTAYMKYTDVEAVLYITTAYVADVPPIIELECERGRIRIENDEVRIWKADGTSGIKHFPVKQYLGKDYWGAGHRDAIEDFYRSIINKEPCMLEFAKVEDTVELMLRIYEIAHRVQM